MRKFLTYLITSVLSIASIVLVAAAVYAVPAYPFPRTVMQADGTEITIQGFGDEFFHWVETQYGEVIAFDASTGNWYYATLTLEGVILPGYEVVGGPSLLRGVRLTSEHAAQLALAADRTMSEGFYISDTGELVAMGAGSPSVLPRIAHRRNRQPLLVLLIEYIDRPFTESYAVVAGGVNAFWSNHFFGTAGNTVNTYFREMSGDFDLQFTIPAFTVPGGHRVFNPISGVQSIYINHGVARVTMNRHHPSRECTAGNAAVRQDVETAFRAVQGLINFSGLPQIGQWNLSEDFNVYAVIAGYEASRAGNPTPRVWGHASVRWTYIGEYKRIISRDAFEGQVFSYGVNGELFDTGVPSGIGVTVHELGHVLGLPDLYSDIPNGVGVQQYCVMGHGSWGARAGENGGDTPTPFNPWARYRLGFISPTRVYHNGYWLGYVGDMLGSDDVLKVVNPSLSGTQYFMVENRQMRGFDAGRDRWWDGDAHTGILIYHIDERVNVAARTVNRTFLVNCNNYHRTVAVEGFYGNQFDQIWNPITGGWDSVNLANPFFTIGDIFNVSSNPNSNFHVLNGGTPIVNAHVNSHPQIIPSGISIGVQGIGSGQILVEVGTVTPVVNFIRRLYENVLNRNADPAGLTYWHHHLITGTRTGSTISYDFFFTSPEFSARNYSNEAYLNILYETIMGRPADPGGFDYWINQLNRGVTRRRVLYGFLGSPEFAEICASFGIQVGYLELTEPADLNRGLTMFVYRLYHVFLNRTADIVGLNYNTGRWLFHGDSPQEIAYGFVFSPEFNARYLSDEAFLGYMYRGFMDRPPDHGGLIYLLGRMATFPTQADAREYVFTRFSISPEFAEIVASFGL